jgi:hypothetical protein
MPGRVLTTVDPLLLYGIPVILLLTLAVALLPLWTWLVTTATLVLGAAVTWTCFGKVESSR